MPSGKKNALWGVIVALVAIQALLQVRIDPMRHEYEPANINQTGQAVQQLPIEFALGAVVGFREAVAGLLWVRADEFFHNGDYEAITPMVRIVTWLDPHQIDVYETGAWHMDFNFTDQDQRSDRRYIPLAVALLKEGIQNNPTVPALDSDLAFTHYYRKIEDFKGATEWYLDGQNKINQLIAAADKPGATPAQKQAAVDAEASITTLSHGLAHAYEGMGDIPDAMKQWQYCIDMHKRNIARGGHEDWGEESSLSIAGKNLQEMQERLKWRKQMVYNQPPVDLNFEAHLTRVGPKQFVASGTLNIIGSTDFMLESGQHTWSPIDGARVEIRIQDANYKMKDIPNFNLGSLNLDENVTVLQDAASVRGGKWEKKLDMSRDPQMYGFKAPLYTVTFWFNPSNPNDCPPNVQDRYGWLGEGITDKHYLDTSGDLPGDILNPVPGLRYVKKTITLTRDELLGTGRQTF